MLIGIFVKIKSKIQKGNNKMIKAVNIKWDVDDIEDLETLQTEIDIPDGIEDEDEISDYISDVTGFCHTGFDIEYV